VGPVIESKRVLITGGSGFLGRHLVSHLLNMPDGPDSVIVFSRGEHRQAEMRAEINDPRVRYFIGDVRDVDRLRMALRGVDVVIHAAAMKRVESCEYNPFEAVLTNVMGTANVSRACLEMGVSNALFISSDKAAAASTPYGKTKACGESIWLQANAYSGGGGTRFAAVRYGNVANSQGSVIPIWAECMRKGEPLPITNGEATRFWFTAEGAVDLVLDTLAYMNGGELVVPELPTFKVADLAAAFGGPTREIGFRGQEKMHECMISADEAPWFWWRMWPPGRVRYVLGDGSAIGTHPDAVSSDDDRKRMNVDQLREALRGLGVLVKEAA
jgi:UDP-N-acetylglucosamine 4,6-dehydratase